MKTDERGQLWLNTRGGTIVDVTAGRGDYEIPEDCFLLQVGETYLTVNSGVTVRATNDIDALLPFQQADIYVAEGRSFTDQEYSSGAKVCLLPMRLAELLDVKPGDTIDLSLAVREGASWKESYWAGAGFQYEDVYDIVGLFSPNDDYRDVVFIPKSGGTDLSPNKYAYTLGQARLRNDRADRFFLEMQEALPPRVRLTVYDQGYAAAAAPVRDVLRIAVIITVACALTTLAVLALFGFLFVYRQRGIAKIMRRTGVSSGGILSYFVSGSSCIALFSTALAAFLSSSLSGYYSGIVHQAVLNYSANDMRYSNAAQAVATVKEFTPDIGARVFILTMLAMFAAAALACFVFSLLSVRSATGSVSRAAGKFARGRVKHAAGESATGSVSRAAGKSATGSVKHAARKAGTGRARRAAGRAGTTSRAALTRSQSLSGGPLKYSWLSVRRGASRSYIPLVLCAFAAVLLLQLTGSTEAYQESYDQLVRDTDLSGYVTDKRGTWRFGLLLDGVAINDFYKSGKLSELSVTKTGTHYVYGLEPPEVRNSYTMETYFDKLQAGPGLIWTNDLSAVQEFYGCAEPEVAFIEGYDLAMFADIPPGEEAVEKTMLYKDEEFKAVYVPSAPAPAIVSSDFLEQNGLSLGDVIVIPTIYGNDFMGKAVKIVGSFTKQGSANNIYIPLNDYHITEFLFSPNRVDPGNHFIDYSDIPSSIVFSADPDAGFLQRLSFSGVSFKMKGAAGLGAFKSFLYERGYSEVSGAGALRIYVTIEDKVFLATERSMAQRLWYMQKIFPALYVLIELLAALVPFILIQLRKRETALMRAQGAAKRTAFFSVFWEQVMLCLPGVVFGGAVWLASSKKSTLAGVYLTLLFALLWLAGTGVSALSLNRGSVRTILKAEE